MDVWQETNWFALQTQPFRENLAVASAAKLDMETFLPRIRQEQLVCGACRLVIKPLFPGYFFARFCPLIYLQALRHAHGVVRVVGTKGYPIPLEGSIIASIRECLQADGLIQVETRPFFAGDKVTVEQGPFAGWMGEVEREWDDGKRVLILLEAIQKARLLIEKRWLSAAPDAA